MRISAITLLAMLALLRAVPVLAGSADPLARTPALPFTLVEKRPHDRYLFTQGMAFHGELLVESGGNYGESRVLVRDADDKIGRAHV